MRRRWWSLLLVLCSLAIVQSAEVARAPSATAAPECLVPEAPPDLPEAATGEEGLIAEANQLATDGRLDAAERLYETALEADEPDPRSGAGLAWVQARRAEATRVADSAKALRTEDSARACFKSALEIDRGNAAALAGQDTAAPSPATPAGRAADRWDAFYEAWVDPLVRILLPALAVLAVLLLLARLVTQVAVPIDAKEWKRQGADWWGGLLLLIITAGWAASLAFSRGWVPSGPGWRWGQLVVVVICLVAAQAILRHSGVTSAWPTWVSVAGLVALVLATWLGGDAGWPWVPAAAVAWVGVVLVASSRGRALRLQIQVKQADKADPTGTAYVLARLQELGTSPPEGLKTPQQVDVTELPTAALSSLPAGRIAAVLKQLLDLLLPSVPWRATVEDGGGDALLVVTLTRNGSVAQTALVDPARFLPTPAEGGAPAARAIDRGDLLTAAAAIILTELAKRHSMLARGLCGATRWDSVAAHVVATKPPGSAGGRALRRELLAYAVDADPENALAQAAYINFLGEGASEPDELKKYADHLLRLREDIDRAAEQEEGSGYLPLQLRTLHVLTATRLNLAAASTGTARWSAWRHARGDLGSLKSKLDEAPAGDPFAVRMRDIASELSRALQALVEPNTDDPAPRAGVPPSLHVVYDEACRLALTGKWTAALDRLEIAAGLEDFRTTARRDPWFGLLRDGEGCSEDDQKRFWSIVGDAEPVPEFTDLAPFGAAGDALRALGIRSAEDLLAATRTPARRTALAVRLDIPQVTAVRWYRLAGLVAGRRLRGGAISVRDAELLLAVGVASAGELRWRTMLGLRRSNLLETTRAEARGRGVVPPRDADVQRWIGWPSLSG